MITTTTRPRYRGKLSPTDDLTFDPKPSNTSIPTKKAVLRTLIESMLLRHEARRYAPAQPTAMTGSADTTTIDLVTQDNAGTYLLIMIEDRPWSADPAHTPSHRRRSTPTPGSILESNLVRHYPRPKANPSAAAFDCEQASDGQIAHITNHPAGQLANNGIGFQVNPKT